MIERNRRPTLKELYEAAYGVRNYRRDEDGSDEFSYEHEHHNSSYDDDDADCFCD